VFRMAGAVRLATRRKGRSPMRSALARKIVDVVLLGGVPALIACSSEPIGDFAVEKSQAISLAERILGFEGSVGPAGDWRPSTGQVASTSTSGEGAKSLSLYLRSPRGGPTGFGEQRRGLSQTGRGNRCTA
jgi:hypothetical protein